MQYKDTPALPMDQTISKYTTAFGDYSTDYKRTDTPIENRCHVTYLGNSELRDIDETVRHMRCMLLLLPQGILERSRAQSLPHLERKT
jgi:hypothetical protein